MVENIKQIPMQEYLYIADAKYLALQAGVIWGWIGFFSGIIFSVIIHKTIKVKSRRRKYHKKESV